MEFLHILVLALLQGLTEFLPISSSGHLILPKELLGWQDQGLVFDVAVHLGSLSAVLIYFRRDVWLLGRDWTLQVFTRQSANEHSRLAWMLLVATWPVCLVGLLADSWIEQHLRSIVVVAWATLGFGLVLGWADWRGSRSKTLTDLTWMLALAIGLAQVLALIPGTSRSGITISMALLLGLQRQDAARFSFLLSIPVILASGGYKTLQLVTQGEAVPWVDLLLATVMAGISAFLCIYYFLRFIEKIGMTPFVIYRLLLGGILLYLAT